MTYTASHIANYMLQRAFDEDRDVSPMKLLKLVYIAYGWGLAVLDRKLFDEPIYAWAHGPVVRSLYDEFKHYGGGAIREKSIEFDMDKGKSTTPKIPANDADTNIILDRVWEIYKVYGAWALRNKTHEDGSPWKQVYDPHVRNTRIPDELIKTHFEKKIREYLDNDG
ncbi:MAG: DUF4065 domain-containing protein [Alphaproteobacteria bacterium]|nr:MAG: DUF4065 domain-containing protein [Alphaproteobacteria bacterium]